MEEDKKLKFVCKYCNKKFPCGKSLGGHLRAHRTVFSTEVDENGEANGLKLASFNGGRKTKMDLKADETGGQSGYGLRENPKKTWRFVDSDDSVLQQERICEECGKGFQSLKALCGHMACHSVKEKQKVVMDSQSDTENCVPSRRRRSKRIRMFKKVEVNCVANGSSSCSGIEQEDEELAVCLMMLSRDSCMGESSDNSSVILEAKSSLIGMKYDLNGVCKVSEFVEKKKPRDRKLNYAENGYSQDSDSGYFVIGSEKVQSNVSIDGFGRNRKMKKSKVEAEYGFKWGKKRINQMRIEAGKDVNKEEGYEGLAWSKSFNSDRALECHYTNISACSGSICGSVENSSDTFSYPVPMPKDGKDYKSSSGKDPIHQNLSGNVKRRSRPKKIQGHVCPFCSKVFRSGQALGGHKRSHFVGGSEEKTVIVTQEVPKCPCLLDLNLPVPSE